MNPNPAKNRGRRADRVSLENDERDQLKMMSSKRKGAPGLALRAKIVLACADGSSNRAIGLALGVCPRTVATWRQRFLEKRLEGLRDKPRPGRPRRITDAEVARVLDLTLSGPPAGATMWTSRAMAAATGWSHATILAIWRACGVRPDQLVCADPVPDLAVHGNWSVLGLHQDDVCNALAISVDTRLGQPFLPFRFGQVCPPPMQAEMASYAPSAGGEPTSEVPESIFDRFIHEVEEAAHDHQALYVVVDNAEAQRAVFLRHWQQGKPRWVVVRTANPGSWRQLTQQVSDDLTTRTAACPAHRTCPELSIVLDTPGGASTFWLDQPAGSEAECVCDPRAWSRQELFQRRPPKWRFPPKVLRRHYWPCRCNQRWCRNCRVRRYYDHCRAIRDDWVQEFGSGPVLFMTLTYRSSSGLTSDQWLNRAQRDLDRLRYRWKRDWGYMPPHIWSLQWTKAGTPHWHILMPWGSSHYTTFVEEWLRPTWADIAGIRHFKGTRDGYQGKTRRSSGYRYCVKAELRSGISGLVEYILQHTIMPFDLMAPIGTPRYRSWGRSWNRKATTPRTT